MKFKQFLGISLCAVILGLGVTSCNNDEDNYGDTSALLAGTWKLKEVKAKVEVTNPEIEEEVTKAVVALSTAADDAYAFSTAGTYKARESAETEEISGTYTTVGNRLILNTGEMSVVYSFDGDSFASSQDVKAAVAEQLGIDESEIISAIQINVFDQKTK